MGKKSRKHHTAAFDFSLPEAPEANEIEMVNYISNVNSIFEFFPERQSKVIKCLSINWKLVDDPHKEKVRLLYRYMFCYYTRTKQTSSEMLSDKEKDHLISQIKILGDEVCHYSQILVIYEMTRPADRAEKTNWYQEILEKLVYDNTIDNYDLPICRLMYNLGHALSSQNVNSAFCSHMNEFISKLMTATETPEDMKFVNVIAYEVPRREDNQINDLINVSYRDKEIDKLYDDLLNKDFTNFQYVLKLIDMLKYIPRKTCFDKMISELKCQKDINWKNTHVYLNSILFMFR